MPPPTPAEPPRGRAVVLYGPPASGKDTITAALSARDDRYQHFAPLKAGPGRTAGYRPATTAALEQLRAAGALVWETHRYGAVYAIDHAGLAQLLDAGAVPVLHLAEPAALPALAAAFPGVEWTTVALTCPRDVALGRIERRGTGDTGARLAAYDAFQPLPRADVVINTDTLRPDAAADLITAAMRR
jgi:guanylate kinase